jgi:hypothetical protein
MPPNVAKIGELLVERGKITEHQLKAALHNQGFFREHLGTTLFKMGFIDEETLGEALAVLSGVPYARPIMFQDLSPSLINLLPTKLAEKHDIVPLRLEGRRLHVAMLDPRDLLVLDEIAFITGYAIQPWIASELRIYDALERYYKVVSKRRRTIKLKDAPEAAAPQAARPAAARHPGKPASAPPEAAAAAPSASTAAMRALGAPASSTSRPASPAAAARPELGLDGRPLDALPEIEPPPAVFPTLEDSPRGAASERSGARAPAATLDEVGRALQRAETRGDVAEALLDYAGARLKRAALFVQQKDRVIGWDGRGDGVSADKIKELQLSLDAPSIFSAVRGGQTHYLGGVPDTPVNRDLYRALGTAPPGFILLVPISIKGRPAAVFYADDGGASLSAQVEDLLKLGRMAALALEILILRTKIMMA